MKRRKLTAEDRLALRLSRHMGAALAQDEYKDSFDVYHDPFDEPDEDGDEEDEDEKDEEDESDGSGKTGGIVDGKTGAVKMETVIADLLGALGISLPSTSSKAEFRVNLYKAAMAKIRELTGNEAAGNHTGSIKGPNPLLTGQHDASDFMVEQPPMFMSLHERLAQIERIGDHRLKGTALSMAVDNENLRHRLAQQTRDAARQLDAASQSEQDRAVAALSQLLLGGAGEETELTSSEEVEALAALCRFL